MWADWVHHSWRFGHAEALREVGPEMHECGSKTSTVPAVSSNLDFFRRDPYDFLSGAIGDHGRNLVISLWPGDKATINGVAAQRLTLPQKIPSAKIRWKSSRLEFFGIKTASSSLIIFQRAKVSTMSITHLWWCNWRIFLRKNTAVSSLKCPGSLGTCNPEETCLRGLPVSWLPTLFSGSGPVRLPPFPWTEKPFEKSPFFVRRGGHCCRWDLVGRTTFWIFFEWLAKVRATG